MIRAVIFDLDGTLLNSLADLAATMNEMLRFYGFPERESIEYHCCAIGSGAWEYVKACLPEEKQEDEELIGKCFKKYCDLYEANPCLETKAYDGILELLTFLKSEKISINVLSNKPDAPTKALVKSRFSDFSFDYVFGERAGIPRKPNPQGALEIADNLKLSPSEVVFVGDSGPDMKTGLSAGMVTVGALWGYRDENQLKACGAKLFARTPQDVIKFIKDYK